MRAVTRRIYDMCVRVVNWALAHPDDEPGFGVLLVQLPVVSLNAAKGTPSGMAPFACPWTCPVSR
jgi:hypothetical protein